MTKHDLEQMAAAFKELFQKIADRINDLDARVSALEQPKEPHKPLRQKLIERGIK